MGKKKVPVALGHKILVVIDKLLKDQTEYREHWTAPEAA